MTECIIYILKYIKNFSKKFEYDRAKQIIHQTIYTTVKEE